MRGARPERALELHFARQTALASGDTALVALSGGSDSVALLALAATYAKTIGLRLTAVHVNHGIRASAFQDEAVALAACVRLEVPLEIVRVQASASDEAHLRAVRYEALTAIAQAKGATRILTGHTAQDQSETVLLALFRGTGRAGLRGMPRERELAPGILLERPLLRIERAVLRAHCARLHLPYVIDPTNSDLNYRRNALRAALQQLRPLFPGLDRAVARHVALAQEDPGEHQPAGELLRAWLAEQQLPEAASAERIESIVRFLDVGRGKRLRITLEERVQQRSTMETNDRNG